MESRTRKGVGASVQFIIDPVVEFGLNAAIGRQHFIDASGNNFGSADTMAQSYTTKRAGAFATVRFG